MPDIQHAIQIECLPEAVYPLISTGRGLAQWWAEDVTEADGAVTLGFFNRSTVYRLRREANKPPLEVSWLCETGQEWSGTHIRLVLESRGSGTFVRFSHSGWQSATDYFISCNTTWGELMFRLKAAAEGKSHGPLFATAGMAY